MHAIGLDLSLTCPGICAIPLDWDCDIRRVWVAHYKPVRKSSPRTDLQRALRLDDIAGWLLNHTLATRIDGGAVCAIESLPTRGAFAIAPLAELHGCMRRGLYLWDITTRTAPQSTARKLFMGKLPRNDIKEVVRQTVQSIPGCANWTGDECDAFVVANWLCAELGAPFMAAGSGKESV